MLKSVLTGGGGRHVAMSPSIVSQSCKMIQSRTEIDLVFSPLALSTPLLLSILTTPPLPCSLQSTLISNLREAFNKMEF